MAKALINKGIPIKADNPKDPYIRDENGIKDIVDSSTVFGKTLGKANGKIQLKNGSTVLSEVSVPAPDLSDYGKTLDLSGTDLSLKNGDTVLSTVTLPGGGGGGGSSSIDTVVGRFTASTDDFIITIEKGTMGVGKLVIIKPAANLSEAYLLSKTYNCASASSGIKIIPCFGNTESANNLNVTKWSASQTLFGYIFNYSSSRYYVNLFSCPTSYDKYVDNSSLTSVDRYRNLIVNSNAVVTESTTDTAFIFYYNDEEKLPASIKFITTLDGKFFYIAEFTGGAFINKVYYGYNNNIKYRPTYFWSYSNVVGDTKVKGTLEYNYTDKVFNLAGLPVSESRVSSSIFIIEGTLWTK